MVVNMSENTPVEFAKAIADATRQRIMRVCCCSWCSVGELVEQIGVSQPTVSHHLAILRDAGLVWLTQADVRSLTTDPDSLSYVMNLKLADPDEAQAFVDTTTANMAALRLCSPGRTSSKRPPSWPETPRSFC